MAAMTAMTMDHLSGGRFILGLGASGPQVVEGWLPFLFSPSADAYYRERLAEGFAHRAAERTPQEDFEVVAGALIAVDDDVARAADQIRPWVSLYVGGMGTNFHTDVVARLGYERECARIQELYLAGKKNDAIAAVTTPMVEDLALIGPWAKIKDELARWQETVITPLLFRVDDPAILRGVAELMN